MVSAAEYGVATSHRLAQIANSQTEKIDEVNPETSIDTIRTIAALTRTANDAAGLAISLAKTSADRNGGAPEPDEETPENANEFDRLARQLISEA